MTDQCQNCTVRGDIDACRSTPCFHHENWYAKVQTVDIKRLKEEIEDLNMDLHMMNWYRGQHLQQEAKIEELNAKVARLTARGFQDLTFENEQLRKLIAELFKAAGNEQHEFIFHALADATATHKIEVDNV